MASKQSVKRRAGRHRSDASRSAILASTFALLGDVGFNALSIEGVAAHAGVGKATIYRWWPSKGVLAVEAFLDGVSPTLAFMDTESVIADITLQAHNFTRFYRSKMGRIMLEMLGSGQCDKSVLKVFYDGFLRPRRDITKTVLQRGIDSGELRAGIDLDTMLEAIWGPLFYRMMSGFLPVNGAHIDTALDLAFNGVTTPKGRKAAARYKSMQKPKPSR